MKIIKRPDGMREVYSVNPVEEKALEWFAKGLILFLGFLAKYTNFVHLEAFTIDQEEEEDA